MQPYVQNQTGYMLGGILADMGNRIEEQTERRKQEVQRVKAAEAFLKSLFTEADLRSYPTTEPLMRAFVDRMSAMEGKDGVLSISIGRPAAASCAMLGRCVERFANAIWAAKSISKSHPMARAIASTSAWIRSRASTSTCSANRSFSGTGASTPIGPDPRLRASLDQMALRMAPVVSTGKPARCNA